MIAVFCVVLLLLALLGLVLGAYIFVIAAGAVGAVGAVAGASNGVGGVAALVGINAAASTLTLGAVSLGMLTIAMAVDRARADQVDAARDTTAVAAEHMRRESAPRDPALASKRARIAAEHEARVNAARDAK